ncbi:MAG: DUF302 domain-containing protein [Bacteroidetes bacterium]|nr:DUF302 domain-containing protein [Bacteroidota bacterium]
MSYYFTKKLNLDFDEAISRVTEELKKEGFGILTEIDVKDTLKKKIDVDFRKYKILGACNPVFAHKALSAEPHIGTMLPCNVIVQQSDNNMTEVSAIDPVASMMAIQNEKLGDTAMQVRQKLKNVIENL